MRAFILITLCGVMLLMGNISQEEPYVILQNKPVQVGTPVSFTLLSNSAEAEELTVAWDFGDGEGLGPYTKGLSATHTFDQPGVYYIFARILGTDIPVSVVQMVTKTMPRPGPTQSATLCMDTTHQKLWSVNPDNNSVALIDPITNQFLAEIPTGKHPRTVAVDQQGNAWVANEDDATLSVITSSGHMSNTLALPYASRPYGVCFDPLKNFAYVTLQGTGKLLKIDVKTKAILSQTDVGRCPRGIAVTADGRKILVTQFISPEDKGLVRVIEASSMKVSKIIALAYDLTPDFEDRGRGVPNFLSSITISPEGTEAWVPSKKDNTARGLFRDGDSLTFDNTVRTIVSKIDMATGEEVLSSRVDINDADMACAVAFSPYGNMAFVALQGNNKVVMLDVEHHSRLGSIDTVGLAPQGMVLNADGTRLFVHNFMSRSVRVFDTKDIVLGNNQVANLIATIVTVQQELLPAQVLKGKQIFYNAQDERMTFAGYISCASCHLDGGSDERVWDFTDRGEGFRNTHTLQGKAGTRMGNVHWTGNFDEIQDFENDMRNGFKGKGFLSDEVFYSGSIRDPLGDKKAGLSPELDALAAYVNSLDKVHPSPYRHSDGTLTEEGLMGKKIFKEAGCSTCHSGPDFTDRSQGKFHEVGTIQPSSGKRRNQTLIGLGTPTLKGIWETAPYLHDGSAKTLRDVLVTKNPDHKHADLSRYSETEITQLIAYLNQIDDNETSIDPTNISDLLFYPVQPLSIFPNPATHSLTVKLPDLSDPAGAITIFDQASGQILSHSALKGTKEMTLDLSLVRSGTYLVEYTNGTFRKSAKLIVK